MKTNDFNKPLTSHQLNENMYKKFGVKMNFDKYTREELEDYRNLLRTRISQHESKRGFNDLLADDSYQKDKYLVGILNTRIKEIVGESKLNEKAVSKQQQKFFGMAHAMQKGEKVPGASKELKKVAKTMSKKDVKDFAKTKHEGLPKKKVKEDITSIAELAQLHAMEYMKAHRAGKLDHAMHHKAQCEACGGKLSHGPMGEVYHTHTGVQEGMPYAVTEGGLMNTAATAGGAAVGGAVGGPVGAAVGGMAGNAMTSEAKKPLKGGQKKLDVDKDGDIEADDLADLRAGKKDKGVKEEMKVGDTKKSSTGGTITKTKTGVVHKAGNAYSGKAAEKEEKAKKVKESLQIAQAARLQYLREDEEEKAKTITAGTDMVNDFTTWMTRVGQYQTKSMIELADAIRQEFGQMESEAFKQAVAPALEQALQSLTQTRETISTAVATLASGGTPSPMGEPGMDAGMDAGMPPEPGMDAGMPPEDEFGAADAAAGGAEVAGREQREARELFNKKLNEAHSLLRSLSR